MDENSKIQQCVWGVSGENWTIYTDGHTKENPVEIASIVLKKIINYKNIPSLNEYFLVNEDEPITNDEIQVANDSSDNKPIFISTKKILEYIDKNLHDE